MKLKYWLLFLCNLVLLLVAYIITPILPAFAELREGPSDNGTKTELGYYLPDWLFWFSTNEDNPLGGDTGWRTEHCPKNWDNYLGMVLWLYRNPLSGFCRSVLAYAPENETYVLEHSGRSFDIDKSREGDGYFLVTSNTGRWHYRLVKSFWKVRFCYESGWQLDVYMKNIKQPVAPFIPPFPVARIRR